MGLEVEDFHCSRFMLLGAVHIFCQPIWGFSDQAMHLTVKVAHFLCSNSPVCKNGRCKNILEIWRQNHVLVDGWIPIISELYHDSCSRELIAQFNSQLSPHAAKSTHVIGEIIKAENLELS